MSKKFKKIEVNGFKSFADKLEIKFSDGITAIVGPNGCGKSNVADSVRWVLGEQSAKTMRGDSMQDVIFKGTEKRKSVSFCEVSLHFDNSEKWFADLPYDEVVITRKLYRSGESEYLINKQPCRLRDIKKCLRESAMGRDSYSIIGQGDVSKLLEAKPEDRRSIFEDAAGIGGLKASKAEAEKKLENARNNLERINDILTEKSNALRPLTAQAETAKKYLAIKEQLRKAEINSYIYQYGSASEAKAIIDSRLEKINEEIVLKEKEHEAASAAYTETFDNFGKIDTDIGVLRREEVAFTENKGRKEADVRVLNERIRYLTEQNKRLVDENENFIKRRLVIAGDMSTTQNEHEKKKYENKIRCDKKDKLDAEFHVILDKIYEHEAKLDADRREMDEASDKLSEIKSNMTGLLAEKETLINLCGEVKISIENYVQDLCSLGKELEEKKTERDVLIQLKDKLQSEFDSLNEENNSASARIAELSPEVNGLSEKCHVLRSRQKVYKDMAAAYEGYAGSVKNLLSDAGKDEKVGGKILGVIGRLLKVDSKFEIAMEIALGSAVQNVVVKNPEDAEYLINYLKEKRYGRVTFLPLTWAKPNFLMSGYRNRLTDKGIFGIASELVEYAPEFDGIIKGLLGATVIVDAHSTGKKLAESTDHAFKIVTLDGDVFSPARSVSGGSKKSEIVNVFSQERELKELTLQADECKKQLDEAKEKLSALEERRRFVSERARELREEIHKAEIRLAGLVGDINTLVSEETTLKDHKRAAHDNLEKQRARIVQIDADVNSVGELEATIREKKKASMDSSAESQKEFDKLRSARETCDKELREIGLAMAGAQSIIWALESKMDQLKKEAGAVEDGLEKGKSQLETNKITMAQLEEELAALTVDVDSLDKRDSASFQERLAELEESKQQLQVKITALDKERELYRAELSRLREKKSLEEMQLMKVDTDIEQMRQHVFEDYGLEHEQCLEYKDPEFNPEKGSVEINRLKRQVKSLGYVNVNAIEQSRVLYEEYHALDVQREDVEKGAADAEAIIKKISAEMLSTFNTKFAQIRENFKKIFFELFDGGRADLIPCESDDPLLAGIEIVAQPPEKKLQSISLLSGGERALTSIAILFAILRLRPMPFCILDEIEAALDDANAGRFARYLRRFSEETQFIVITHRKPTMELSDSLYGVTMEEKGVSKIVSVRLADAVASAESV